MSEEAAPTAEDRLRADLYDFLGALLAAPPDAALLRKIAALEGNDSALGRAVQALREAAAGATPEAVADEFHTLFIGVGRGELVPYGSYYMTGFLNEKPLAALRDSMAQLAIRRAADVNDPEDHIASVLEMMAALISGRLGAPAPAVRTRQFFDDHVAPWAGHFFSDLECALCARFYQPVGAAGRAFMEIETEAFRMQAE